MAVLYAAEAQATLLEDEPVLINASTQQGYVEPGLGKMVYAYAHPLFWAPYALVGDGGK